MNGCVGVLGFMGESEDPELSGTILCVVPKPAIVSDPGIGSEVGGRPVVTSDNTEESGVSPLGEVDVGLCECSGVLVGSKLASGVNMAKSEVVREESPGVSEDVLGAPVVPSCFEGKSGMGCAQEPKVICESEGSGEVEKAGDEVLDAVPSGVGCSSQRSNFGFLGKPVSTRGLGAGKGWLGLLLVLVATVGPGLVVVGVPLDRPLPAGVSHVQGTS